MSRAHCVLGKPSATARAFLPEPLYRVSVSYVRLHPATDPDAIRSDQCRDVRAAWRAGHRTVEALGDATDLSAFSVRCRLADMGLVPAASPAAPAPEKNLTPEPAKLNRLAMRVLAVLKAGKPMTSTEIARNLKAAKRNVSNVLSIHPSKFVKYVVPPKDYSLRPRFLWRLR